MKQKLISILLMAIILFGSILGSWMLTQEQCCNWTEMAWTTFRVLPVAAGGAAVAYIVARIYEGVVK
jgi:hypothetical protein